MSSSWKPLWKAPNFTNSKHVDGWLSWDGEFDSMQKDFWHYIFSSIFFDKSENPSIVEHKVLAE